MYKGELVKIAINIFIIIYGFVTSIPLLSKIEKIIIPEKPIVVVVCSYNTSEWTNNTLDSIFTQNYSNFRLIIVEDINSREVVGMASLTISQTLMRTTGLIGDVVVDEKYRGLQLGERLIKFLIITAKLRKILYLSLTSHPRREAANALYQKLGFQLIGQVDGSNYYRLYL